MTLTDRMEKERTKVKHEMQLKIDKLKEDFNAVKVDLKQVRALSKKPLYHFYFIHRPFISSIYHWHPEKKFFYCFKNFLKISEQ